MTNRIIIEYLLIVLTSAAIPNAILTLVSGIASMKKFGLHRFWG